jgi:hypothetical protein
VTLQGESIQQSWDTAHPIYFRLAIKIDANAIGRTSPWEAFIDLDKALPRAMIEPRMLALLDVSLDMFCRETGWQITSKAKGHVAKTATETAPWRQP